MKLVNALAKEHHDLQVAQATERRDAVIADAKERAARLVTEEEALAEQHYKTAMADLKASAPRAVTVTKVEGIKTAKSDGSEPVVFEGKHGPITAMPGSYKAVDSETGEVFVLTAEQVEQGIEWVKA